MSPRSARHAKCASTTLALLVCASAITTVGGASAFTHVVSRGETLAHISMTFYGTPRFEAALAGANALDAHGGSAIVAGQPLEIPAPSHHRVEQGETWADLARVHLGDASRAETLARANGGVSWIQPVTAQEIEVPAVVAIMAEEGETMPELARRYLGDGNKAWQLNDYNGRHADRKLARGDVVLVAMLDIALTEEGKKAARRAANRIRSEGMDTSYQAQRHAEVEIPALLADIRAGRYVDAVATGNRLLGLGDLTKPQLSAIHRALLEAYVALEAHGLAAGACTAWRANAGAPVHLDPKTVSPKIRMACGAK